MLSIFVTQQLEVWTNQTRRRILLYYFCDGRDESRNTAVAVLRSLIFQMIRHSPALAEILLKTYHVQKSNLFRPTAIEPLWHIFETMVQESGQEIIYCWIDGADECEVGSLHHLLKKLKLFFQKAGQSRSSNVDEARQRKENAAKPILRMMIVSREEPECLVQELSTFSRLRIGSQSTQNDSQSIQVYIAAKAKEISAATGGSKVDEGLVSAALNKKAEGNFLWVNVAAENLKRASPVQISERLQDLSPDLTEMYAQILIAIPADWIPTVQALLKWTLVATRPLRLVELTVAIRLACRFAVNLQQVQTAISLCGSLLVVQRQECLVAHQSVYDFFLGPDARLQRDSRLLPFLFRESWVHSELTNQCVQYLQSGPLVLRRGLRKNLGLAGANRVASSDGSSLSSTEAKHLDQFPFMNYAVLSWPHHARMGEAIYTNYNIGFFADQSELRDVWWETHWLSTKTRGAWRLTLPHNFTPLHVAAYFGIVPLALHIESKGPLLNAMQARDSHKLPAIYYAVRKNQPRMTSFLLDRGTLNIGSDSFVPLEVDLMEEAVVAGEIEMVNYLLQRGTTAEQGTSGKPTVSDWLKLSLSGVQHWKAVVETVSTRVHWSDWRRIGHGGANESSLHTSASYGNLEVCKLLIQYGADTNAETDTHWKPIHNAAWYGFPEVITLLVDHGADPRAQSSKFYTPLHCAVHESHTECVRLLLEFDKVLDLKNAKGREAIHTACKSDNVAIVALLLDAGADINALCSAGGTPLFYAAASGKNQTVEYLLDHGADAEIKKPSTEENGEPISVIDIAKAKYHSATAAILTAHIQGERVPKTNLTSIESPQPEQQNAKHGERKGSWSPPSEEVEKPTFRFPPPPPLLRPSQPFSSNQSPPLSGPAVATLSHQGGQMAFVSPAHVSSAPQAFTANPNPVQGGCLTTPVTVNKPENITVLPSRPASSMLPSRPATAIPEVSQPATAPIGQPQFSVAAQPTSAGTSYPGPPPPYTAVAPVALKPESPHLVPPVSVVPTQFYAKPAPSAPQPLQQSYHLPQPAAPLPQPGHSQYLATQAYPQHGNTPLSQPGSSPYLGPQVYPAPGPPPPPSAPFQVNNTQAYYPGQLPSGPVHQLQRSKSIFDIKFMGKKIV